ncbi:MAG: glycoside hydrolase family 127 protein [Bifidobacteriaceae bacterium]|jgi:DUF1680 family protein|nr:glycoside hydrolase family 127 protein [Bifidobacteriaceae bacterium]
MKLKPLALSQAALAPASIQGRLQATNGQATVAHCIEHLETAGNLANFRRAADPAAERGEAAYRGWLFADSDVYKTLEAVGWEAGRSGATAFADFTDQATALIAAVQQPNGYINTYVQTVPDKGPYTQLTHSHELYCAGHLIQAAVALHRCTGDDRLLAVARRVADHFVKDLGCHGQGPIDGHPEVETAMVELFRETGEPAYLDFAKGQIERRGHEWLPQHPLGPQYFQDHIPVRENTQAMGHSVRQLYLAAGATDVATETGDQELLNTMERLWEDAYGSKMYIAGGHGAHHRDEGYGDPYELPPERSYSETCASIASFQWCWRLLLATGNPRYADEMERVLYNGIMASTTPDGKAFFYANPLQLREGHFGYADNAPPERAAWYACACCPPNIARIYASLHGYAATETPSGLQLHLLMPGTFSGGGLTATVTTDYPNAGLVAVSARGTGRLALRVPPWAGGAIVQATGAQVLTEPEPGAYTELDCQDGAQVTLQLPLQPRFIRANPRVDAVRGCVAVARGPVIYCLEQVDVPEGCRVEEFRIDLAKAPREVAPLPGSGLACLEVTGAFVAREEGLYQAADVALPGPVREATVRLVPYAWWANRGGLGMRVWLPTT